MKTVYIPKGETVHYESLATEHLVVHGRLHVTYGVRSPSVCRRRRCLPPRVPPCPASSPQPM